MAAILISVGVINCENLACNKRGVHIRGMQHSYAMTRRDFVKPAFSLRIKRFVKTHALSLLGTTRLLSRSARYNVSMPLGKSIDIPIPTAVMLGNDKAVAQPNSAERLRCRMINTSRYLSFGGTVISVTAPAERVRFGDRYVHYIGCINA